MLVGNELGNCTMYNFQKGGEWHHCVYRVDVADLPLNPGEKGQSKVNSDCLVCHRETIINRFQA